MLKAVAHLALFLVAIVVFYVGLGVGLQVSSAWGIALWVAAGTIVAANIFWILRRRPS